jgi:hypothetical protein
MSETMEVGMRSSQCLSFLGVVLLSMFGEPLLADEVQRATVLESGAGVLGPTAHPSNSVFDLFGHNDRFHDNLLTLENDSQGMVARLTCRTEVGSPRVTDCDTTNGLRPGLAVIAPGIPQSAGRRIAGEITPNSFVLTGPAQSGAGVGPVEAIGPCGNAAIRTTDSVIHYERGAFGYSVVGTGCIGNFPDTLYAEVGNIGPPGDPDDTSFAVISTHTHGAKNFPDTQYKAFEVRGDTGDIIFRSAGPTRFGTERVRIRNTGIFALNTGLSLTKRTVSAGTSDTAGMSDVVIYWNSSTPGAKAQNIPGCSSEIDGQTYIIKDEKGDANSNNITVTPSSGTIEGGTNVAIRSPRGMVRLQCDSTSSNWNLL